MPYQRNDIWYTDVMVNGRRLREAIPGCTNKTSARSWESELVKKAFNEKCYGFYENKKIKFREFAQIYLDNFAKKNKLSWKTDEFRLIALNKYFGEMLIENVTALEVEKYKNQRGVSEKTLNRERSLLSLMFRLAIDWKYLYGENPIKKVSQFREVNSKKIFLSDDDYALLCATAKGETKAVLEFSYNTGMRPGEIKNAEWPDVYLNDGVLFVRDKPGNKTGEREIPINSDLRELLLSLKKIPNSSKIFTCDHQAALMNLFKKCGLKDVTPYTLRHTFGTQLLMKGVDIRTVSKLLGHKNIKTTMIYLHSTPQHLNDAVQKLAKKCHKSATETKRGFSAEKRGVVSGVTT